MNDELAALCDAPISVRTAERLVHYISELAPVDDEQAHKLEDRFRSGVLETITSGQLNGGEAAELAALALSTRKIEFSRWCA